MKNRIINLAHAGLIRLLKIIVWPVLKTFGPIHAHKKVPFPSGGVLIVANHESEADPVLVQYCCPRPIRFMAKADLFRRPLLGKIIKLFRPFPVRQGADDFGAIRTAIELLKSGEVVCVFAEGKINRHSEELLEFHEGVSLIARKANAVIVPCAISHARTVWPNESWLPICRHPITVRFGAPRQYGTERKIGSILREEISAMKKEGSE